jgi:hypothetical protein
MINRPDPSNSPDPKMSTAEGPILVESRSSASSVWSLWALSELTSEGALRFPDYWKRVEGTSQKITLFCTPWTRARWPRAQHYRPFRSEWTTKRRRSGTNRFVKFQPCWSWCGKGRWRSQQRALTRHTGVRLDQGSLSAAISSQAAHRQLFRRNR